MPTHRAIATTAKGVFEEIEVPTTRPETGEVLIKVDYASMIAFDTYQTDLTYMVAQYPVVLGFNAAGTVAEVGPGVDDLKVGDRVRFSFCMFESFLTDMLCMDRLLLSLINALSRKACNNTVFNPEVFAPRWVVKSVSVRVDV